MTFRLVLYAAITGLGISVFRGVWPIESNAEVATCSSPSSQIVPDDWSLTDVLLTDVEALPEIVPMPDFTAEGEQKQIDLLKKGLLFIDSRGPLQALDDVRWDDESYGRYYSTQLHGLVGIGAALQLDKPLSREVASKIGNHILNWAYCAARNPEINSRSWYEGTVVKRQSNLLRALIYLRHWGSLGDLTYEELVYLVDANATYLLETDDIYFFGNHGIRQDILLAATALTLPNHLRADDMLRLAERRLEAAAVELFTVEGVWKEHAPGYVNYALRLMTEVRDLSEVSNHFNPRRFLSRIDESLEYLLSSLLPNGQIPYIGKSGAQHLYSGLSETIDLDAWLMSKARSLSVFGEYGHTIVRGDHPEGFYLLFVASQNLPAGKRHVDDLSFLLYNYGRPWISEGGHQSYEMTGMARYLRSPRAHNTYSLNGDYLPEDDKPRLKTEITGAWNNEERFAISGYTERFLEPARFERSIEIDEFSSIRITDSLKGSGMWEGRFQFPSDLNIGINGNTVTATAPSGREMILNFNADNPISISSCYGEESPICGWAISAQSFGPATSLMWTTEDDSEIRIDLKWRQN